METAFRHTHLFSVIIFLFLYLIKTYLLISNKNEALTKFTKITKVPEMIISVLFLGTGIYMVTQVGATILIIIKIVMVLVSIPLAIIGFKKGNKILAIIALLLIIGAYGLAEVNKKKKAPKAATIDSNISNANSPDYNIVQHGKALFTQHCETCHGKGGSNGAMGVNLTVTQLETKAIAEKIRTSSGSMPPFNEDILSEQDLNAVISYVESLKQ